MRSSAMGKFRPEHLLLGRVSMSKQDVEGVERIFPALEKLEDRKSAISDKPPTSAQLLSLARRIYAARERRRNFLSGDILGEPAWDILLALYCANGAGHRLTVSNICDASGVPPTTALRWLDTLMERGFTRRLKNPLDRRIVFIELEPEGQARLQSYLWDIWMRFFPD